MRIIDKQHWKDIVTSQPLLVKMIIYLFIFSAVMTSSLAGMKMYIDYNRNVELLKQQLAHIENTQLQVMAKNIWNFSDDTIDTQLKGIIQHDDIVYLELIDTYNNRYIEGNYDLASSSMIVKEIDIEYKFKNKTIKLAQLKIVATTAIIKNALLDNLVMVVIVEFIKVITICIFIMLLFYYFFNRHLVHILDFARSIDLDNLDQSLVLHKKSYRNNRQDELDRIVVAINEMRHRLKQELLRRQEQDSSLRLSAKVFESTFDGIIITNSNGAIVAINDAFSKITGYEIADVVGKNPRMLQSGRYDKQFYQEMWHELVIKDQWRGEIWNKRKNGETYPELMTISSIKDDDGNTENYVAIFSDITILKQTMQQLEYQAHHNSLTDLPNRLLLQARLEYSVQQAKRNNTQGAVIFLDLDNFKKINDSLGHAMGDKTLQEVARRLVRICREVDTVAHVGGDEFVVVLHEIQSIDDATSKASQVIAELELPFFLAGYEMYISGSLGITSFNSECNSIIELLKEADTAMYAAKASGSGRYCFYSAEFTELALEKISTETELRHALERNELELYYQPQVLLTNKKIVACEALVRWNHPEKGLILPDAFIPLSEETGLILPLGEFVLRSACLQYVRWCEMGIKLERIAVNISGKQIHQKGFSSLVAKILKETQCPAHAIELEITEGFIMQQPQHSIGVLRQIRQLGVALSIDDFGTGHSSLSYLQKLPIQRLKIDKSFVWDIHKNPEGEAIVQAVISLGHSVKLSITAEGIETVAQNQFLLEHQCNEGQGYLYSKPVAVDKMTAILLK